MVKRRSGWVMIDGELKWIKPEPKPDQAELRDALAEMLSRRDSECPWGGR